MKHLLSIILFLPLMCMAQHSQAITQITRITRTLPSQANLGDKTVIYIPTEGNLPILEAGRTAK